MIQDLQDPMMKQKIGSKIHEIQDPQYLTAEQTLKIQDVQDLQSKISVQGARSTGPHNRLRGAIMHRISQENGKI